MTTLGFSKRNKKEINKYRLQVFKVWILDFSQG